MAKTADIVLVTTNARGLLCGESHRFAKHPDATIARARQLRGEGLTYRAIGIELGVHFVTVWYWLSGRRRRPHAKVVAKRAMDRQSAQKPALARPSANLRNPAGESGPQSADSFGTDHQRSGRAGMPVQTDTVTTTVKGLP